MKLGAAIPAAVAVAMLAGCGGGPGVRVDFGGKAVPINVAFGKPKASVGRLAPIGLQPGPGGIGVVPAVPFGPAPSGRTGAAVAPDRANPRPPTVARPAVCPPQDPLAFPRREAGNVVTGAVPEGTFPYRISGSFTVNGKKSAYADTLHQTVRRLEADSIGRNRFSTSFTLLRVPYTVTYAITAPLAGAVQTAPGEIALASTVQDSADGTGASFKPAEPLRLLQLRAERGVSWTEASSDPLSATSATVDGVVDSRVRVNACGQPIDAWKSVVTERTVSAGQDITATRTLSFATGLGGLLVAEEVSYAGVAGGDRVSGQSSMTIDVDPVAP